MKDILVKQTSKTPEIRFLAKKGVLELKGVSIPEDAENIYLPLIDWVEHYVKTTSNKVTTFSFKLIYFNTTTSDYLVGILRKLKLLLAKKQQVKIVWYYEEEDEDMRETGNHFQAIIGISFEFVSVAEIV